MVGMALANIKWSLVKAANNLKLKENTNINKQKRLWNKQMKNIKLSIKFNHTISIITSINRLFSFIHTEFENNSKILI